MNGRVPASFFIKKIKKQTAPDNNQTGQREKKHQVGAHRQLQSNNTTQNKGTPNRNNHRRDYKKCLELLLG
jgi:hypothetical protein